MGKIIKRAVGDIVPEELIKGQMQETLEEVANYIDSNEIDGKRYEFLQIIEVGMIHYALMREKPKMNLKRVIKLNHDKYTLYLQILHGDEIMVACFEDSKHATQFVSEDSVVEAVEILSKGVLTDDVCINYSPISNTRAIMKECGFVVETIVKLDLDV